MTTNERSESTALETASAEVDVPFKIWQCVLCGFIYEEAEGIPGEGIPAGTRWENVPDDWICPECSVTKADFEMIEL